MIACGVSTATVAQADDAPTVTLVNRDITARVGEEVRFTASISGTEPISIQWYLQGAAVEGGTAAELVISNVSQGDQGTFQVVAENAVGSTVSGGRVELEVTPAVQFTGQPESVALRVGQTLELSATANGEGLSYHWLRGNAILPAEVGGGLRVEAVTFGDAGIYQAVVTGTNGQAFSERVRVEVLPRVDPEILQFAPEWDFSVERSGGRFDEVAALNDGGFLLAGEFVRINGHETRSLARFSEDGMIDTDFQSQVAIDGVVSALVELPDGDILVGGAFVASTRVSQRRGLIRQHSDGRMDETFNSAVLAGHSITHMQADSSGRVYVVSSPAEGDDLTVIRRIAADGGLDAGFTQSSTIQASVDDVAVSPTGEVFCVSSEVGIPRILHLNSSGGLVRVLDDSAFSSVISLHVDSAGQVYAHGRMSGAFAVGWIRFNAAGEIDESFGGDGVYIISHDSAIMPDGGMIFSASLLVERIGADGERVASDSSDSISNTSRIIIDRVGRPILIKSGGTTTDDRLALRRYDANFEESSLLVSSVFSPGRVNHISQRTDGRFLILGDFVRVNGQPRDNAALITSNGELDPESLAGAFDQFVKYAATDGQGNLYAYGGFRRSFDQAANGLMKIDSGGGPDRSFASSGETTALNEITTNGGFLLTAEGSMLISAALKPPGAQFRTLGLYRFSSEGVMESSFHTKFFAAISRLSVSRMIEFLDGRVLAMVPFDPMRSLVWVNPDGSLAETQVGTTSVNPVNVSVITDMAERVWHFTRQGIVRYDIEGNIDSTFQASAEVLAALDEEPELSSIFRTAQRGMLAFGSMHFRDPGSGVEPRGYAVRFNEDGSVDESFQVKGLHSTVHAVLRLEDGNFLLSTEGKLRRTSVLSDPLVSITVDASVVSAGDLVILSSSVGGFAETYQWYRNGARLLEEKSPGLSIPAADDDDAGIYWLVVSNSEGIAVSEGVTLRVLNAETRAIGFHQTEQPFGVTGDTVSFTVSNRIDFEGTPDSLRWSTLIPDGWTLQPSSGSGAGSVPADASTSLAEWTWQSAGTSPLEFSYQLMPAVGSRGRVSVAGLLSVSSGSGLIETTVKPDPLYLRLVSGSIHSADQDGNRTLDLSELLRMIEIYNTRNGTSRTGRYRVNARSVDGFETDVDRRGDSSVTVDRFHRGDTDRDSNISLSELLRVIELYNTRSGTRRTGGYRTDAVSVDGFASDG